MSQKDIDYQFRRNITIAIIGVSLFALVGYWWVNSYDIEAVVREEIEMEEDYARYKKSMMAVMKEEIKLMVFVLPGLIEGAQVRVEACGRVWILITDKDLEKFREEIVRFRMKCSAQGLTVKYNNTVIRDTPLNSVKGFFDED